MYGSRPDSFRIRGNECITKDIDLETNIGLLVLSLVFEQLRLLVDQFLILWPSRAHAQGLSQVEPIVLRVCGGEP